MNRTRVREPKKLARYRKIPIRGKLVLQVRVPSFVRRSRYNRKKLETVRSYWKRAIYRQRSR